MNQYILSPVNEWKKPKLFLAKHTYYPYPFSWYAKNSGSDKKIYVIMNEMSRVGIKFVVISAGKLYPGLPGLKNIHGLRMKEVTSHL